ncbi:hypothetical protein QNI19_35115 [Cytophagaceae bacterium DM2B3-1]|uniref:Uncharacterized protein n=1 Tax=Xanthocytophaga flava TaxID=3048013 RepID=A0ABT7CWW5_9BACT|nr:hypothetical protein [Xanthocytophaga flavus]MDJ1498227.1 hypothetical protein [Xanthocytophaga flavus]
MIEFFDIGWLAIKSESKEAVIQSLNLSEPFIQLDWNTGVSVVMGDIWDGVPFSRVYVSSPMRGWVLVVGDWISQTDKVALCQRLSETYEDVWAFSTQMRMDFWFYLYCKGGKIIRHFEKDGENIIDEGELLKKEKTLRKESLLDEEEDVNDPENWYGEDIVMGMAELFTIDPNELPEAMLKKQLGTLAVTDVGREKGISENPIEQWKES